LILFIFIIGKDMTIRGGFGGTLRGHNFRLEDEPLSGGGSNGSNTEEDDEPSCGNESHKDLKKQVLLLSEQVQEERRLRLIYKARLRMALEKQIALVQRIEQFEREKDERK